MPIDLIGNATMLLDELRAHGLTLTTAESCTGGLISACLTEVPGSSDVFERGFVTYSNAAKTQLLDVPEEMIEAHGSVSPEVAGALTQGALAHSPADTLAIEDPVERMKAVRALVKQQRAEPAYPRMSQVSTALFTLGPPAFTRLTGSMLKAIDFVTSNVPGPPFEVYMSGALVERSIPFGPLGGAGLNLTLYSYDGTAEIGINVDRAAVPDGEVLTECLQSGLDEIAALG